MTYKNININNKKKLMKDFKNKTILSVVAAILVAGTAFFTSCEKDVTSNLEVGELKVSEVENPFDFIGEKHNEIIHYMGLEMKDTLDYYAQKEALTNEDRERMFNYILEILPTVITKHSILDTPKEEFNNVLNHFYQTLDYDNYDNLIFNNPDFDVLKNILNEASYFTDVNQQVAFIKTKELELLPSVKELSDTCILVFLNVYRHSVTYWENAFKSPDNPWYNFLQSSSDCGKKMYSKEIDWGGMWNRFSDNVSYGWYKFKKWVGGLFTEDTWAITACADAIGAIIGCAIGSIGGTVGMITCSIVSGSLYSLGWPLLT